MNLGVQTLFHWTSVTFCNHGDYFTLIEDIVLYSITSEGHPKVTAGSLVLAHMCTRLLQPTISQKAAQVREAAYIHWNSTLFPCHLHSNMTQSKHFEEYRAEVIRARVTRPKVTRAKSYEGRSYHCRSCPHIPLPNTSYRSLLYNAFI